MSNGLLRKKVKLSNKYVKSKLIGSCGKEPCKEPCNEFLKVMHKKRLLIKHKMNIKKGNKIKQSQEDEWVALGSPYSSFVYVSNLINNCW